jgi:alanine racemase
MINYRKTFTEIDLEALRFNSKQIQSKIIVGSNVMAVIKADAYGHGAVECAKILKKSGINAFAVATLEEGIELREKGIRDEIYLLYGFPKSHVDEMVEYRLKPIIHDFEGLNALTSYLTDKSKSYSAHLNFDTGMGRLGFDENDIDPLIKTIRTNFLLKVEGMMTHLACADQEDFTFTQNQIEKFKRYRDLFEEKGMPLPFYHISNSALVIEGKLDDYHWVRPGIMLYGIYPNPRHQEKIDLKPVLSLKTSFVSIRKACEGTTISYGATHRLTRDSILGTLNIGYADGYPRLLSNKGYVLVKGKKAPILGRVCMDLVVVDLTDIEDVKTDDVITLIGKDGNLEITATDIANWSDTISYEIVCGLSKRIFKVFKGR